MDPALAGAPGSGAVDAFWSLSEWVAWLEANDLSAKTIQHYSLAMYKLLGEFLRWRVHPFDVDESHVVRFLASIGDRSATKHQYAKGIRSFYSWAVRRSYLLTSPVGEIHPRKPRRSPQERFEYEELVRLLIAAAWRDERRAWAILACLSLGTRRTEFVNIRWSDVRWDRGVVHLRVTKGRRPRDVDLSPWAATALVELRRWSRGERILDIEPNTFTRWVHEAATDCGFPPGRLRRAHTLRATYASMLADAGTPPQVIQGELGHANVATTSEYLAIGRGAGRQAVQIFGGLPGATPST
jgi:integrase